MLAFESLSDDPLAAAVPLRWAAALRHLALFSAAPWAGLWPLAEPSGSAIDRLEAGSQGSLDASFNALPKAQHVAARTGLSLALSEIGAYAGLHLWSDRCAHTPGAWHWGDAAAPLGWLSLKPPASDRSFQLRCTLWPGGDEPSGRSRGEGPSALVRSDAGDCLPAVAHAHGAAIKWHGGSAA